MILKVISSGTGLIFLIFDNERLCLSPFIDKDKRAGAGHRRRQAGDGALPERVPRPSQCEDGP